MQGMFQLQRQQRPWKRSLLPRKAVSLSLAPHKTQEPCSMKTKRTSWMHWIIPLTPGLGYQCSGSQQAPRLRAAPADW